MRVHVSHKIIVGVSLLFGGLALACSSDDSGPSTPRPVIAKTAANNGDAQTATVAQALALPLRVVVTLSGAPQVGTTVTWATTSGTVTPGGPTDANGVATATWTLGNVSGAVTATAAVSGATGSPVTFDATADPDVADELSIAGGNGQTGPLNTALPPLQAKVADQFGNGVPGVTVTWTVTSGDGTVAPATSDTDANGIAEAVVTLGAYAGDVTVDAEATGLTGSPQTFTETAAALPLAVTVSVNSNNFNPRTRSLGSAAPSPGTGTGRATASRTIRLHRHSPTTTRCRVGGIRIRADPSTLPVHTGTTAVPTGLLAPGCRELSRCSRSGNREG